MKKLFILFVAAAMLAVSLIGAFSASAANDGATPDEAITIDAEFEDDAVAVVLNGDVFADYDGTLTPLLKPAAYEGIGVASIPVQEITQTENGGSLYTVVKLYLDKHSKQNVLDAAEKLKTMDGVKTAHPITDADGINAAIEGFYRDFNNPKWGYSDKICRVRLTKEAAQRLSDYTADSFAALGVTEVKTEQLPNTPYPDLLLTLDTPGKAYVLAAINQLMTRDDVAIAAPYEFAVPDEPTNPDDWVIVKYYIIGDADGDGRVTIADATLVQKAAVDLTPKDGMLMDVNEDGRVSILDVTCIQKYLAGFTDGIGKTGDAEII